MINRLRDPLFVHGLKHNRERVTTALIAVCTLAAFAAPAHAQYYQSPYMAMGAVSMVPMLGVSLVRTALMPIGALTRKNNNKNNNNSKNNQNTTTSVNGQMAQPQQTYAPPQQAYQQPMNGQQMNGQPMNGQPNYGQQNFQPVQQAQAIPQGYPGQGQGQPNPYAASYSNSAAMPGMGAAPQMAQQQASAPVQIPGMQNQQAYAPQGQMAPGAYGPSVNGQ